MSLERCPHFRRVLREVFRRVLRERCPHFRRVLIERCPHFRRVLRDGILIHYLLETLQSSPSPLVCTGDYVILLSTGLSWYSALLFNLFSALTAVVGFFVGVGVGTESEEANSWILAFAAGLFIYIALVDLV